MKKKPIKRRCTECTRVFKVGRKDQRTCSASCSTARWKRRNPDAAAEQKRRWNLKRVGVTPVGYEEKLAQQGGACVCGQEKDQTRRLAVDLDPVTGALRGVLCFDCRMILGKAGNDPGRLVLLADYVRAGGFTV